MRGQPARMACRVLSCCLAFIVAASPPAALGQTPTLLHDAIAREAARLAADPGLPGMLPGAWWRVRAIEPGTEVAVVTRTSAGSGRFLQATDSSLALLHPELPGIPQPVRKWLLDLADKHPGVLASLEAQPTTRVVGLDDTVQLSRDGLFVGDQKVAEFVDLSESIDRTDVIEVSKPQLKGNADMGWLAGAAAVIPCLGAAVRLFWCESGCGDGGGLGFLLMAFGCPVAVGAGVYHATRSHPYNEVIYRAPEKGE